MNLKDLENHSGFIIHLYIFSLNIYLINTYSVPRTFSGGSVVKDLAAMQEMQALSLGREDTLQKEMETHSSILAWEIPMDRGGCRLLSMGSQKCRTQLSNYTTVILHPE